MARIIITNVIYRQSNSGVEDGISGYPIYNSSRRDPAESSGLKV